jgi:PASTA domain
MTSPWVVTTSTDRVSLDLQRRGELTFTVTNSSDAADQVVFEPVPGEGIDRSAVTVDNPGRPVPGRGSASFLVHLAIPQQAAAGRYELYGQAYSAHLAPEETLGRSGRVVFDVAAPPQPKKRPWWLLAVAGLVIVVLGVVGFVVLRPSGTAVVPDVVGQPQAAAGDRLDKAGLKLGTVRHRLDAANDGKVLQQATAAGTKVAKGTGVDVVVGVNLRAPNPALPAQGAAVAAPKSAVKFEWGATPGAASYHLVLQRNFCNDLVIRGGGGALCNFGTVLEQTVKGTTTTGIIPPVPTLLVLGNRATALFQWTVTPLDDFGTAGTTSALMQFTITS